MKSVNEVEVDCTVVGETDKALKIDTGSKQVWIPKSQITDECEDKGKIISVFVPEWLAIEKGLV